MAQPSLAKHRKKQPWEGQRSLCLGILWALGPSVEISGSGASGSEAFCVGLRPFLGLSLPRQSRLEVQRTRVVLEA